jgi:hypothetical protein
LITAILFGSAARRCSWENRIFCYQKTVLVEALCAETHLLIQTLKNSIGQLETLRDHVAGREEGLQLFFENKLGPYHSKVTLLTGQGRNFEALPFRVC